MVILKDILYHNFREIYYSSSLYVLTRREYNPVNAWEQSMFLLCELHGIFHGNIGFPYALWVTVA